MISLRFILLITSCFFRLSHGETGYLKFCGDENKNFVSSNSCSKGLWLDKPLKPGCVCAKGVWALSNGLCDKQSAVIVGDDHCFHVGFEVRVVKFIGNPNDPFSAAIYSAPASLDSFIEIPPSGLSAELPSTDSSLLIAINPKAPVVRGDNLVCVELIENMKLKLVHLFPNPPRSPSTKWTYQSQNLCNDPKSYKFHLGLGEMYQANKVLPEPFVGRKCLDECPRTEEMHARNSSQAFGSQKGRRMPSPSGRSFSIPSQPSSALGDVPLDPVKAAEAEKELVTIDLDDYHQEVNEQTIRMMHAHITPTLLGFTADPIKTYTKEFEYINTAREVATVLCPEEYVPKNLIVGLMRMFKQLLWETIDQRPHEEASSNDEQFKRITDVLALCKDTLTHENDTAQKLRFEYVNYTGFYNFSGSPGPDDPLYPKPEQCPEPLIFAVHGRKINATTFNLKNATGNFNRWMKFNVETVDFVIETAWKMVTIGHYHCGNLFNDTTAPDFSSFFHQMELFFNDKIIKRWYDPVNVANTYRILQLIFPNYNLKKVAFGLDLCMLGAQQFSTKHAFNAKWIQRPKRPFTDNDLRQEKYIIPGPGSGTPLSTNDYAPKLEPTRPKRAVGAVGGTSMWGGKAKCMENFADPVNLFGYKVKPGCKI